MTSFPIPESALDDRLAFVGTSGSGKTYAASASVEHLLAKRARCVIVDPLGVWYGLRLVSDGKTASPFDVVIFGGNHGDLPLNEHVGSLIGETVAGMKESCIIDLSGLAKKADERRFMLAFLDSIYRKTDPRKSDPYHIIFDEADLWAPQKSSEPMLQSRMEEIVRRGRIRGFIPWLITQRPAVLSKDVLSQADGLIALKLTSSQDRDAIGGWIEGQADRQQGKAILGSLPAMQNGQGVVWLPGRGILDTAQFPVKATFDSSRTPKRGEKKQSADLKPLNIEVLKQKLATVEAETKANDPKLLKAEISRLKSELSKAGKAQPGADAVAIKAARDQGYGEGYGHGLDEGLAVAYRNSAAECRAAADEIERRAEESAERTKTAKNIPKNIPAPVVQRIEPRQSTHGIAKRAANAGALERPLQRIIDSIRWWNVMGVPAPTHPQAAFMAGYSHKSGTWANYLSRLRTAGLIEGRGDLKLTTDGAKSANEPDAAPDGDELRAIVLGKIDAPLAKILKPIIAAYPGGLSHSEAADYAGYSPQSGTWANYLSRLRTLDLIEGRGELKAQEWLFP